MWNSAIQPSTVVDTTSEHLGGQPATAPEPPMWSRDTVTPYGERSALERLPTELLLQVVSHLDAASTLQLTAASRTLHDQLSETRADAMLTQSSASFATTSLRGMPERVTAVAGLPPEVQTAAYAAAATRLNAFHDACLYPSASRALGADAAATLAQCAAALPPGVRATLPSDLQG